MKILKFFTTKKNATIVVGALLAIIAFFQGWATTGQPDANLLEVAYIAVGSVVTRFFVYSQHSVDRITSHYKSNEETLLEQNTLLKQFILEHNTGGVVDHLKQQAGGQ